MMKILTGKTKVRFKQSAPWYFWLLPLKYKNLIVYRWFNTNALIGIDMQNWDDDGFDYGVQHPFENIVFTNNTNAGERDGSFDSVLEKALIKANEIYNQIY